MYILSITTGLNWAWVFIRSNEPRTRFGNGKCSRCPGWNCAGPIHPSKVAGPLRFLLPPFGFCFFNACRIVYVMEEHEPFERYGFAYGTLPQHGAIGEERFTVE